MSKTKKHNQIKREALKRKVKVTKEMALYGMGIEDDPISVGILMDSLGASQKNFLFIDRLGNFLDIAENMDITVFVENIEAPCTAVRFPIFNLRDFYTYHKTIIVSTVDGCLRALEHSTPHIFFYVYDIDFLMRTDLNLGQLYSVFNNKRVTILTRCVDYRQVLTIEFNIKTDIPIIEDWDFVSMFRKLVPEIRGFKNV